jgi:hypothetical protein
MPAIPPGPGDVVTIPDPSTGGAGAPVIVSQVFNAMWKNAHEMSRAGLDYTNRGALISGQAPHMVYAGLDTSYLPPLVPILPDETRLDGEAMYNAQRDKLLVVITEGMARFIADFFPNPQFYEHALKWCDSAMTTGGTGIDPLVEQQLWERARARLLADSARMEDEAVATWANRRFPMPPGALHGQLQQISLDASRKLAEQSRDISIKSFDTEIENVRFAVKEVIDQRQVALNAMGDYIRTLMQGPQVAMQLTTGLAGVRSEAARNMVALYTAQSAAADPRIRLAITDAQLRQQAGEANLKSDVASIDAQARASLAAAQMFGTQAASGFNALHAGATIGAQDSTSN